MTCHYYYYSSSYYLHYYYYYSYYYYYYHPQVLTKKWKKAKVDAEEAGDAVGRKAAEDKETVFDSLQVCNCSNSSNTCSSDGGGGGST